MYTPTSQLAHFYRLGSEAQISNVDKGQHHMPMLRFFLLLLNNRENIANF